MNGLQTTHLLMSIIVYEYIAECKQAGSTICGGEPISSPICTIRCFQPHHLLPGYDSQRGSQSKARGVDIDSMSLDIYVQYPLEFHPVCAQYTKNR